jgi:hypothetical protein
MDELTRVKTDMEPAIELVGWIEYYILRAGVLANLLTLFGDGNLVSSTVN